LLREQRVCAGLGRRHWEFVAGELADAISYVCGTEGLAEADFYVVVFQNERRACGGVFDYTGFWVMRRPRYDVPE